jgi:hypothetical protein
MGADGGEHLATGTGFVRRIGGDCRRNQPAASQENTISKLMIPK